ncbi:MAG TPA: cytochrome c oxidase assembly protein [Brevundimonas sp.]|jgi:putative membrane protein|uniref:cytochrome c oxidase assembly protein n=1 Tax=Brevundimonas sp. TaxID=1871086 RepID=UPI002DEA1C01|nr:cytochrome c oxidase assembly protein [Brevundimonas sp.]
MIWTPYCGPGPVPAELWTRWNGDPLLLAGLAATAAGLVWAARRQGGEQGAAWAAVGLLTVSFVSPLCALSSALFTARTAHHLLLILGAAPLIALLLTGGRDAARPLVAAVVHATVFWIWHAPAAYAAALSHDGVYWTMQISLLASAVWFWRETFRAGFVHAAAGLLAVTVQMGLLGAVLTFSEVAVYAPHFATTSVWGLSPVEDQRLAGLIMWAPAAGAYLAAALWVMGLGLRRRAVAA